MFCTSVIVCGITGCAKDYETMKAPEGGWTMEELLNVTYLCGKQLSYPLTVDDLGKDFTVDTDVQKIDNRYVTNINYKGEYFAPCIFGADNNTDSDLKYFSSFAVDMPQNTKGFDFSLNGVGFDNTKDEILKALGTPDYQSDNTNIIHYKDRQDSPRKLIIIFNNNDLNEVSFVFGKN